MLKHSASGVQALQVDSARNMMKKKKKKKNFAKPEFLGSLN